MTDPRTCPACLQRFTCGSSLQLHYVGRRSLGARCRTPDEMLAKGMGRTPDGAWKCRDKAYRKPQGSRIKPGHRPPFA